MSRSFSFSNQQFYIKYIFGCVRASRHNISNSTGPLGHNQVVKGQVDREELTWGCILCIRNTPLGYCCREQAFCFSAIAECGWTEAKNYLWEIRWAEEPTSSKEWLRWLWASVERKVTWINYKKYQITLNITEHSHTHFIGFKQIQLMRIKPFQMKWLVLAL